MNHQVEFDSEKYPQGQEIGLACGYISMNEITFLREKCMVTLEAKTGEVAFYDREGRQLLTTAVELPACGDEKYSEVRCQVEGDVIRLGFPQYRFKDNYPNCDGEHDRWTKYISGYTYLRYDLKKHSLVE